MNSWISDLNGSGSCQNTNTMDQMLRDISTMDAGLDYSNDELDSRLMDFFFATCLMS